VISIVEPLCHGPEHSPVNAGLVQVVRRAFPEEPVVFYGAAGHIAEVRAALGHAEHAALRWNTIEIPPRNAELRQRWRHDLGLLRRVVTENEGHGHAGHVLSLQSIPSVLFATAALRAMRVAGQPIQAVLHGYLNEALGWRSRNPLLRAFDMRSALNVATGRVQLIALEPGISDAVGETMPHVGSQIATLRHPLPPLRGGSDVDLATSVRPIRFGFLGLATRAKGFDAFAAAARALKPRYGDGVEFHALGRLPVNSEWHVDGLASFLATVPSTTPIPREHFEAALRGWHYVCLPYRVEHYTLSASGVLLDAMAHGKPIIAGSTPAVRELFAGGRPGVLVGDVDQFENAISGVIETFSPSGYREQAAQMRKARERRSPERLAQDYLGFTFRD